MAHDDSAWVEVLAAKIVNVTPALRVALAASQAEATGSALAEAVVGCGRRCCADNLGVFELQQGVTRTRPTYEETGSCWRSSSTAMTAAGWLMLTQASTSARGK